MYQFVLFIHVFVAMIIILLVLIQQGKGSAVGSAFGGGASQTVFGSRGSGSFLLRLTIGLGMLFFTTSVLLNYLVVYSSKKAPAVEVIAPQLPQDKAVKSSSTVQPKINQLQKSIENMPLLPAQIPDRGQSGVSEQK